MDAMKKPKNEKIKETESDRIFFYVDKVISHLRGQLKRTYGLWGEKGIEYTVEDRLLQTIKGLDHIHSVLFKFLRDGESLKNILEMQKGMRKTVAKNNEFYFLK